MTPEPAAIIATRRQLHAVAQNFIAGPQYRARGTIRLAACADGVAGTALPVSIRGARLVWSDGSAPLRGPVSGLVAASGLDFGPPPATLYEPVEQLDVSTVLSIDPDAAGFVCRALYAGRRAVESVVPQQEPVLWPEHFDIGAAAGEVNYGVSAGDDYHPLPYAYVGPWTPHQGAFWNAPFGALQPLAPAVGIDSLAATIAGFFVAAQAHL